MAKQKNFSKKEALSFGFETTKKHFWQILKIFAVFIFALAIPSAIRNSFEPESLQFIFLSIILWIWNVILDMGMINIALKFGEGKRPQVSDLLFTKGIITFILASFVSSILIAIGFVLLIIPGIYAALRLQFVNYLIVDRDIQPVDSIKASWKMSQGHTWNLFLFALLIILLNIAGALALVVGLFITVPTSGIASAYVYHKLVAQATTEE